MLPLDPGHGLNAALPDTEGPAAPITTLGLIRWTLWRQRVRVGVGAAAGIAWMGALALIPVALGGAIGGAVDGGSNRDVLLWCTVLAAVVALEAGSGIVRHRTATLLYHRTEFLVERLLLRRVLDRRGGVTADAGAVLAHAQVDARAVGGIADLMCRGSGAVVTFTAVGIGMLVTSPLLGAVVLIGLPLAMLALVPLWRPYDRRAGEQQARLSAATATAADILTGMRVVRGLGGETVVRDWFAADSAEVRRSALSLARVGAVWDAVSAVIPGLFLALVLALGGRLAVEGDLSAGKVVAFTGLAVFLAIPLATLAEVGDVWASGIAGARRLTATLNAPYAVTDPADRETDVVPAELPAAPDLVLDAVVHPGLAGLSLTVHGGARPGSRRPAWPRTSRCGTRICPRTASTEPYVPRPGTTSSTAPRAWRPRSASGASCSPAVSANASRPPGRSRPTPPSWSSRTRPVHSTPSPRPSSPSASSSCAATGPHSC